MTVALHVMTAFLLWLLTRSCLAWATAVRRFDALASGSRLGRISGRPNTAWSWDLGRQLRLACVFAVDSRNDRVSTTFQRIRRLDHCHIPRGRRFAHPGRFDTHPSYDYSGFAIVANHTSTAIIQRHWQLNLPPLTDTPHSVWPPIF